MNASRFRIVNRKLVESEFDGDESEIFSEVTVAVDFLARNPGKSVVIRTSGINKQILRYNLSERNLINDKGRRK